MFKLKYFVSLICFLMILPFANAQEDFKGVITIKEKKRNNTITKKVYVKGDKIRVETYLPNDENALKGVRLVDLKTGKVTALLPSRKLYLEVPDRTSESKIEVEINKTDEATIILGHEAKKTTVKDPNRKTQIEFWITEGNFIFFAPAMALLNKNENMSAFFGKISDKGKGAMPLKMIESRDDGTVILTREVTVITDQDVEDVMFIVPEGYTLQER